MHHRVRHDRNIPTASYSPRITGSGFDGLSGDIALRRAGYLVTIYERYSFGGEVGASLSLAPKGSHLLQEWEVGMFSAQPVVLRNLIMHDWSSGDISAKCSPATQH